MNINVEVVGVQDLCQTNVHIITFACMYYICAHMHIVQFSYGINHVSFQLIYLRHFFFFASVGLFQNVPEAIPPSLKAILKKDVYQKRGHYYIRIDDSEIDYDERFR